MELNNLDLLGLQ